MRILVGLATKIARNSKSGRLKPSLDSMLGSALSVVRFAAKMLWHEKAKTLGGACGVAFAVCLTLVQIGLYRGVLLSMSLIIRHSSADIWVMARGPVNLENT